MLVIFVHELKIAEYTTEDTANRLISGFPTMPSDAMKSIENLEMFSFGILQEMEKGKGYGNLNNRSIYFAWELPCPPAIGWTFGCPLDLGFDLLNTVTNIYFGTGDTLLCEYE